MHKQIRKFSVDGVIRDDSDFARLRTQLEYMITQDMRDQGYIPVLDIGPFFSTEMRKDNTYNFIITLYGVYVGKAKSWVNEGYWNGKMIPKDIRNTKSSKS